MAAMAAAGTGTDMRKHLSMYDEVRERPETLGETITHMIDGFRIANKEIHELKARIYDQDKLIDKLTIKQQRYDRHQEKQQISISKLTKRWAKGQGKQADIIGEAVE